MPHPPCWRFPGIGRIEVPRERAPHIVGEGSAKLVLRAEKLTVAPPDASPPDIPADGAIALPGTVEAVDYQGQAARYFLRLGETPRFRRST